MSLIFWLGVAAIAVAVVMVLIYSRNEDLKIKELLADLEMYQTQLKGLLVMDDATIKEIAAKQKQIDDCKRELRKLGVII